MHNLGQWEELADALRDELAEYGGLLALLDEQRDAISKGGVDSVLEAAEKVREQARAAEARRNMREEVGARLARHFGRDPDATVRDLVSAIPPGARPMFDSLIEQGSQVAALAQKKVRRNALMLARATDLNDRLIMALRPQSATRAYNKRGGVYLKTSRSGGGLDLSA
ncbi:MAG TPA: flagellar export chaperone FlgN [Opitutales bacterium]|nr:flagellar export chaperone FlgN [Opitutales bacterium]